MKPAKRPRTEATCRRCFSRWAELYYGAEARVEKDIEQRWPGFEQLLPVQGTPAPISVGLMPTSQGEGVTR